MNGNGDTEDEIYIYIIDINVHSNIIITKAHIITKNTGYWQMN